MEFVNFFINNTSTKKFPFFKSLLQRKVLKNKSLYMYFFYQPHFHKTTFLFQGLVTSKVPKELVLFFNYITFTNRQNSRASYKDNFQCWYSFFYQHHFHKKKTSFFSRACYKEQIGVSTLFFINTTFTKVFTFSRASYKMSLKLDL